MNVKGESLSSFKDSAVNAVTWGVFPDCEIMQPTVVDPVSFYAWKSEAFSLWLSMWLPIYDDSREYAAYAGVSVFLTVRMLSQDLRM